MTGSPTDIAPSVRDAALAYAGLGLRVHPLRLCDKRPRLKAWQALATTNAETITTWWTRWPDAGVGIATGAESGVVVIDVDPRHGGDDALAELERQHGPVPDTWRCLTPSGGIHLYFRHPGGRLGNRAGVWPGIDVRGDGGYVVAPPTVLADGREYAWEVGHAPAEVELRWS